MAVAYFKADGLPAELERIPIESIGGAVDWLQSQEGVAADDIAIVGWSKGAELVLVLAAQDPRVSRVVAIAPSHVVWAGILSELLLLSGGKDEVWPAGAMADALCERAARRAGVPRCEHHASPMLGHLLDGVATTPGHALQQRIERFLAEP